MPGTRLIPVMLMKVESSRETKPADHASQLLGTRALVSEERFNAVVGLLLRKRAVSKADVADMFKRLAERLECHRSGHDEYRVCPIELGNAAGRLRSRAAQISGSLK